MRINRRNTGLKQYWTGKQIEDVRARYEGGESVEAIMESYGVSRSAVVLLLVDTPKFQDYLRKSWAENGNGHRIYGLASEEAK